MSAELRAFPRLSWAHPARMEHVGQGQAAQVSDLSLGGCKLMPSNPTFLAKADLCPGHTISIEIDSVSLDGTVRWATPNFSALGCSFLRTLTDRDIARLGVKLTQTASA